MAETCEKSFPFDSEEINGEFDREYLADDFARYFRAFISSGIFMREPTNLQIVANNDMSVTLKTGSLIIEGYRYDNTADITLMIEPADGVLNRIDRVVLTWDKESRDIHCELIKGEFGYAPVAPECRRNEEYKDYAVADIYVKAGVIQITQSAITDQRLNTEVCGLATPFVELDLSTIMMQIQSYHNETMQEIETWQQEQQEETDIWQQEQATAVEAWIKDLKEDNTKELKAIVDMLEQYEVEAEQNFTDWYNKNTENWTAEIDEWFNNLKEQLSENAAVNLQKQIGNLTTLKTEDKTSLTAAVNEVKDVVTDNNKSIGNLEELKTETKESLVGAVNEIKETHLLKVNPVAENSFSLGRKDDSEVGENSATFGKGLTASALGAVAFALYNAVSGNGSFATGMSNNVSGLYAEAFGQSNKVAGRSAHAEGLNNYASSENQHVQGRYNVEDAAGKYAHIVGNGSSDSTRSNAHTLDWSGNAWFRGDVKATDSNGDSVSLCDCIKLVETGIITGESVMIDLKSDASYLLVTREITVSTGKIYGFRARMICTPKDFVATPSVGNLVASTNAGVTFANVNDGTKYGITLIATSTYEVSYSLYEFANTYGDYYYNVTG